MKQLFKFGGIGGIAALISLGWFWGFRSQEQPVNDTLTNPALPGSDGVAQESGSVARAEFEGFAPKPILRGAHYDPFEGMTTEQLLAFIKAHENDPPPPPVPPPPKELPPHLKDLEQRVLEKFRAVERSNARVVFEKEADGLYQVYFLIAPPGAEQLDEMASFYSGVLAQVEGTEQEELRERITEHFAPFTASTRPYRVFGISIDSQTNEAQGNIIHLESAEHFSVSPDGRIAISGPHRTEIIDSQTEAGEKRWRDRYGHLLDSKAEVEGKRGVLDMK